MPGVGTSIANATTLAMLDLNNSQIRITSYDTNGGAAAAAQRAIADGNRLILGPLLAEDVRAVAPIARGAGVPLISFSNDMSLAGRGTYRDGLFARAGDRAGRGLCAGAGGFELCRVDPERTVRRARLDRVPACRGGRERAGGVVADL